MMQICGLLYKPVLWIDEETKRLACPLIPVRVNRFALETTKDTSEVRRKLGPSY